MADKPSSERNVERSKEMQSFQKRLETFLTAHQLSKRRASQQTKKKTGANIVEWPHVTPSGEDLARAGFFFRPALDSLDNVQCFHCSVKLDGWERNDDPFVEHLAHSASCDWAQTISAGHVAQQAHQDRDDAALLRQQDPMSAELLAARRGTFDAHGGSWPHESKRGWKCKVSKMIEAGWCYDPAPPSSADEEEELDGVTCFYCNLSLDGWEPKDDPFQEHTKRSPECAFFALVQAFGSAAGAGAGKKGAAKGKGKKGGARNSTASKGLRLSTQSALSQFSETPSFADVGGLGAEDVEMEPAGVEDSILSTASQATAPGTIKGKKGKGGRAKAPAKGAKGRKRAGTVDSQAEVPLYPDLSSQIQSQDVEEEQIDAAESQPIEQPLAVPAPAKKTRKAPVRGSKAPQIDSSVIEVSLFDLAPKPQTKATRGRKAKAKVEAEQEVDAGRTDDSEVSAQLQDELDRSLSIDVDARFEIEEQRPAEPEKLKRGTKRTSDGLKKAQQPIEDSDMSATVMEFPAPPKAAPAAAKGKKGRKASKQIETEPTPQPSAAAQEDISMSDIEATKPAKGKKAPATKAKGKGKKTSSARSSRSSKATVTEPEQPGEELEDLERDEREIEAELERIAAEQAKLTTEQDKTAEFEASPSLSRSASKPTRKSSDNERIVEAVAGSPPTQSPVLHKKASVNPTPSPAGSDKENDPSQSSLTKAAAQGILSPTKTMRVPLAPGTPNRLLASPSKRALLSPSKQISHLTSSKPWEAIDLDAVLLASPQPTPGTLAARLAGAASGASQGALTGGGLTSPEKNMSVEEWVRFQARRGEEELKRKCEEMVSVFEGEGMRALGCLGGIAVVA